ncbi:MAG TPA: hypothetical protein VHZ25_08620 [Acidobacteriaceae bacterium]|jgi:hypothetical protein|nr:hypothetical protein [Acidobacteriaceae bacterium]
MNAAHLITQLLEIERAIGKVDSARVRSMLFEAEQTVLDLEQQMIGILVENETLRRLVELSERAASAPDLPQLRNSEKYLVN